MVLRVVSLYFSSALSELPNASWKALEFSAILKLLYGGGGLLAHGFFLPADLREG